MRLSRRVPARTVTAEFPWITKMKLPMGPAWRKARERMRNKLDKCWWCKRPFEDGDEIYAAAQAGKKNVVLCGECAKEAL